jgi:hypothetical protein
MAKESAQILAQAVWADENEAAGAPPIRMDEDLHPVVLRKRPDDAHGGIGLKNKYHTTFVGSRSLDKALSHGNAPVV